MPSLELQVLRRVNLDWAVTLDNIWRDTGADVPEIYGDLRKEFTSALDGIAKAADPSSPLGWVIVGQGGTGKTHLLGQFRAECMRRKACFVLVDMTDVNDFWDTVLLGYFTSLQQTTEDGRPQFERLIAALLSRLQFTAPLPSVLSMLRKMDRPKLKAALDKILGAVARKFATEAHQYGDVLRAVVALDSLDFGVASVAGTWLMGHEIESEDQRSLGLAKPKDRSSAIVRALSWMMSLGGPSVVALDQLDPIVTQLNLQHEALESTEALAIINKLGAGLSELRDVTRRTLTVVSCVEQTWGKLTQFTPRPFTDRFEPQRVLQPKKSDRLVEALLAGRLRPAFTEFGYQPQYPTWPFKAEWLHQRAIDSPREILKSVHEHVIECVRRGEVIEVPPGWKGGAEDGDRKDDSTFQLLDERFQQLRSAVDVKALTGEANEDDRFGDLIRSALRCVLKEVTLPKEVDAAIDENFAGAKGSKPLHARLRLIFHKDNSREEHVCLRALQKTHAGAFTARLRLAITQSGINKSLKFRRMVILRTGNLPGGAVTTKLIQQFESFGGVWLKPKTEDLATLEALRQMEEERGFVDWIRDRRHSSSTDLIREALAPLFKILPADKAGTEAANGTTAAAGAGTAAPKPAVQTPTTGTSTPPVTATPTPVPVAGTPVPPPAPAVQKPPAVVTPPAGPAPLLLGYRLIADKPATQPTTMPIAALQKHGIVFAGAGSGKTVLLKRIVEEAALLGVPSIVVDVANDLAAIGDAWPTSPPQWSAADAESAARFRSTTECVVWTPGKDSGNPLGLEPLPDLTALVSSPEEFHEAVQMAVDALAPVIATGPKSGEAKKRAILTKALAFLGQNGDCDLNGLGAILGDLPQEATTKIADEKKIAAKMADELNAQLTINPLLKAGGPVLDPAALLTGTNGRTRVSVISLIGLLSLEAQQHFLNQLAMILFSWIKKHPTPPNQPLRGLLVIDEARDFVPSGQASACLGSLQRLAAQARKYGLGLILATQAPKGIDNKIVGQCSTHWYGKMSSPAAIDAVGELLRARGTQSGDDVGSLKTGRFYVSNADYLTPPTKLMTPMCLSAHRGPMEPEAIVKKAVVSRGVLAATPAPAVP